MGHTSSRIALISTLVPRRTPEQVATGNDGGKRTLWLKGCVDDPATSIFKTWLHDWDPERWRELPNGGEPYTPAADSPCADHPFELDIGVIIMHGLGGVEHGKWQGQTRDFWVEHRLEAELLTYDSLTDRQCTLNGVDWSDEKHKAMWYIDEGLFFSKDGELFNPDKDILRIDCTKEPESTEPE